MPELPEVETIVRSLRNPSDLPFNYEAGLSLRPGIIGRKVIASKLIWGRSLAYPDVSSFQDEIIGQSVISVNRRGKFIVINFDHNSLLIHLRMSGDIVVERPPQLRNDKHDRLILNFADQTRFVFNDPRKFGRIWLVKDFSQVTSHLGPEPLEDELTPEALFQKTSRIKKMIKPLLLDQSFLAGMGNIYTDEALFEAEVHPETPANMLTRAQTEKLLHSIQLVLRKGIEHNGASIDWVYRGGSFQNLFNVYRREGLPCNRCGTLIIRGVVAQRGTHFCPNCQRLIKIS